VITRAGFTIDDVNGLDRDRFVATFGHVYESTPALAAATWERRPFVDRAALLAAFRATTDALDESGRRALLCAHPQLAATGPLTADSANEQHGAGLTDLDMATRARIEAGNARYLARFGFPFIIAVLGLTPADIAAALD
jgi:2-oxo-4-hydroxy-4-carboxy-5-ureidoimidazoline decarboxylase